MRVTIKESSILSGVNPFDVVSYLRSRGWQTDQRRSFGNRVLLTLPVEGQGDFEVVIPIIASVRDYPARIGEVLQTLEVAESRSQLELLRDIETSSLDLIRITPDFGVWPDGSITIDQGEALVSQTKELLLAAACATVRPAKLFPTRKAAEAVDYMRRARLGQTEHGSFVLTILSPVTPELQGQMPLFLPDEIKIPFARRVTQTLFRSLAAVKQAAIDGMVKQSFEPFGNAVPAGVSANLCDAIVRMQMVAEAKSVDFRMSWARVRQPSPDITSTVEINQEVLPIIEEASKWLKETTPQQNTVVEGIPFILEHASGSPDYEIVVPAVLDGKMRKVRILVSKDDYEKVFKANVDESTVRCEGTLKREGRSFVLDQAQPLEF